MIKTEMQDIVETDLGSKLHGDEHEVFHIMWTEYDDLQTKFRLLKEKCQLLAEKADLLVAKYESQTLGA